MVSKTATRILSIFFLILGIALTIFIVTQGFGVYKGSKGYVSANVVPSVDCVKYFYAVSEPKYENGELSFLIENLGYSADINNVTVVTDSEQSLPLNLVRGTSQTVKVGAGKAGNFSVYPENCAVYKVTCLLGEGKCNSGLK